MSNSPHKIYCDAAFDWEANIKLPEKFGFIGIVGDGIEESRKMTIPEIPGLKQYINLLELHAIKFALETAKNRGWDQVEILTDSQVAASWASKRKILMKQSEYHQKLQRSVRSLLAGFKDVKIVQVPRDKNPAGEFFGNYGKPSWGK
jgi:ribonuclease HI